MTKVVLRVLLGTEKIYELVKFLHIIITCPCNVDPLTPHFYVVKLGFTGVYIIFFFFLLYNIYHGYSLEPPQCTQDLCFEQK